MNKIQWAAVWIGCMVATAPVAVAESGGSSFAVAEQAFLLDGKPFIIRAGEMHYARIPREYWAHRLKLVHAMGLNTVSPCALFGFHRARPSGIVRGNNK